MLFTQNTENKKRKLFINDLHVMRIEETKVTYEKKKIKFAGLPLNYMHH